MGAEGIQEHLQADTGLLRLSSQGEDDMMSVARDPFRDTQG